MALPVIDNLRAAEPRITIDVWCGRHARPVFEWHPGVNDIIEIPSVPTLGALPGLSRRLRASKNDGFFVLDRSRFIAAACRVAGATVLGTVRNPTHDAVHETDRYLGALRDAGITTQTRQPALHFDTNMIEPLLREFELAGQPFVVLHPGGAQNPGAAMLSKRWPVAGWRALISWLEALSIRAILTGGPDEIELCQAVAQGSGALIAAGRLALMQSATLAAGALAYVGPDTGLTHLAAASGVPVIALFGPTNPRQYAPRGARVTVLAAPGAELLADVDLRRQSPAKRPATAEIPPQAVIEALTAYVQASGAPAC